MLTARNSQKAKPGSLLDARTMTLTVWSPTSARSWQSNQRGWSVF